MFGISTKLPPETGQRNSCHQKRWIFITGSVDAVSDISILSINIVLSTIPNWLNVVTIQGFRNISSENPIKEVLETTAFLRDVEYASNTMLLL
jgi:hypothetical protein